MLKRLMPQSQTFRAEMRGAIDQFKTIEPSRGQVRRSEEQIAEASVRASRVGVAANGKAIVGHSSCVRCA